MNQERIVKLFKKQFQAFNFTTQFAAAVAGVQSGKTFVGAHWILKKITENPDKAGIIVAPTYKILQQATLKKFFEVAPEYRRYFKEGKSEVNLPTGGVIYIRSAENPLTIEGISPYWWWLDEGGMTSPMTWTVLRSRVSMTGGQGFITTTPYNMGWLYKDFFIPWKERADASLSFFTWSSIANPKFPKEFFESEKKRLTTEEFGRRYLGEFNKMSGLIYDLPEDLIIAPIETNFKTEARIMGVDWGFRHPSAISVWYLRDQVWHKVDEWKQAEHTTAEIIQVLHNKLVQHRVTRIYADSAEPDRIEECRRARLPIFEASKDVLGGLNYIQQLIKERRLFICNNCLETLAEISMYHWLETREGKLDKDEPEKFNDDLMDADRYAIYSYQPAQSIYMASPAVKAYYPELNL